ncbi:hypothetical protein B739_0939 [Riemerella anatipestifer RA-CH-1]|uniref:Uncharacterized protein n=2 Tax=Riemerella anatipestifer TaxID=34085 RepID=J9R1B3_RIEAN|nr:hypothetical protein B739_0939 [Riemerella anatipestifer RA-CH-1]AIH02575.1 hypothetical protein M949_1407 [Riemerella anatipestifer CH3]AQY21787.1 hypothetical protein AB406_0830 [Riemerella anatipestifer]
MFQKKNKNSLKQIPQNKHPIHNKLINRNQNLTFKVFK